MSHDAIIKHRQNSSAECRIQFAGKGLYLGRSCRNIDATVWLISPPGLPVPSGCSGNRYAGFGRFTLYSDHYQNNRRCRSATPILCENQRHDDRRDCGAGRRQFSRQAASPWLIALGEVMTLNWNIVLIVCKLQNWNKSLPFWCRIGNADSMNPPN